VSPIAVLIVGRVGVGKSMVCGKILEELPSGYNSCAVNFSAQTSSNSLQDTIEGKLEKRSKGTFAPPGGKRTVVLCDDFNMPAKSVFGFMPPLELLKLWADNGFWYDRGKQEVKHIKDIQLMASMAPPGGGRNAFSQRIMAVFGTVNMTDPSEGSLKRIYATLLNSHLSQFDDSLKPLGDPIVKATIELYATIAQELLPTPSKSHYLFNTRDLAKVIQGTMQTTPAFYDNKDAVLQLWCHECHRVFGDRMWDANDQKVRIGPFPNPASTFSHTRLTLSFISSKSGCGTNSTRSCCITSARRGNTCSSRFTASARRS
jgi:dynein heavy chain